MEIPPGNAIDNHAGCEVSPSDSDRPRPEQTSGETGSGDRSQPGSFSEVGAAGEGASERLDNLLEEPVFAEIEKKVTQLLEEGGKAILRHIEAKHPELLEDVPESATESWTVFVMWLQNTRPAWLSRIRHVQLPTFPIIKNSPILGAPINFSDVSGNYTVTVFEFDEKPVAETMVLWYESKIHFLIYPAGARERTIAWVQSGSPT